MALIVPEPPGAAPAVETLLDRAFGPDRHLKTAQRLRDGQLPVDGLSYLAIDDDSVVGTIRFWALRLGHAGRALLLGPVAVDRCCQGQGLGGALIRHGLRNARKLGHAAVILVGDEPYYRRFGFSADLTRRLVLPGPVDRRRFLGLELAHAALARAEGAVTAEVGYTLPVCSRAA